MPELHKIIKNIMVLPLDQKAYIAEILLRDIDTGKTEPADGKRTFGEYIGKIKMSNDFNNPLPDEFRSGESDETSA